jgi:hypothetical protein
LPSKNVNADDAEALATMSEDQTSNEIKRTGTFVVDHANYRFENPFTT